MPPDEHLPFKALLPGEANLPEIWPEPLPLVVTVLEKYTTWEEVADNLPDIEILKLCYT